VANLEGRRRLGESAIWELQKMYFAQRGVEAWRQGEVPHYVTSNPTIANSYAEIVLGFRRDRQKLASCPEPLTIVELGAGSGRFAFHFLRRLEALCREADVPPTAFRYVLTDAAEANLAFWRSHPNFEAYFADGRLETALFDMTSPGPLALQSGGTIGAGSLAQPAVVVANYAFDSIPQDLFHFKNGRAADCLVSLDLDGDADALDAAEMLAKLEVHYEDQPLIAPPYPEPALAAVFETYRRTLKDAHVLFPAAGMRCLDALTALSPEGALILSADKGNHRLAALEGAPPPGLVRHGSVSMSVNYHAFAEYCAAKGGLARVPDDRHGSINIVALTMLAGAETHVETQHAYRRTVQEFGPDHFYSITKHVRETIPAMSAEDLLAYLRLSRYDSHQFGRFLPRLTELAPEMDSGLRAEVAAAIEKVWEMYYPLGEDLDLANKIGGLLYAIDDYAGALSYFERSMAIYGPDTGTLYNIGACLHCLGDDASAAAVLTKVLEYDPANEDARRLLDSCESHQTARAARHA